MFPMVTEILDQHGYPQAAEESIKFCGTPNITVVYMYANELGCGSQVNAHVNDSTLLSVYTCI